MATFLSDQPVSQSARDILMSLFPQRPDLKDEVHLIEAFFKQAEREGKETIRGLDLNFLALAIEAYRREIITYAKLLNLAKAMSLSPEIVSQLEGYLGIEEPCEDKVYIPDWP